MGWQDRWSAWRDRLTTRADFRHWAARNPITRPIARRRARALFDICAGFVYSQVLLASVRLGLFELLRSQPRTVAEVAQALALSPPAAERLLRAAAALGLCDRRSGGRFGLGKLGVAMIDNPGVCAMVEHHVILYDDLRDPVALLRGEIRDTALGHYWPYAQSLCRQQLGPEATEAYTALMAASQRLIASEVFDAYPLNDHRCLLDVGGGDGSFASALAHRAAHLRIVVFDLPSVAVRAATRIAANGLTDRLTAVGGDFHVDQLPMGADVITLLRVLHDLDDARALRLLRAVRQALMPGGTILIAEPMAQTPGAEPAGDAYFGFYLLAMGMGRPRTSREIAGMLGAAGFSDVRPKTTRLPLMASIIIATAPHSHTVNES